MAVIDVADTKALREAIEGYLDKFPGDLICALQVWYEGLGGQGVPKPNQMEAMETVLGTVPGWEARGDVRYEKFGVQNSFKRIKYRKGD